MLHHFLFIPGVFESAEIPLTSDSAYFQATTLVNNPISSINQLNNGGFILFSICFFIIIRLLSYRHKLLLSMASRILRNKDRHNIFYETTSNGSLNKTLLCGQTILLISIILYCIATREQIFLETSLAGMFKFLGISSLLLIVYFIYKFLFYSFIGTIYFKKEDVQQWNDNFLSLICLSGIFLFFPALILFYVKQAHFICLYVIIFYFFSASFAVFYKIYALFFKGKDVLLYFILYLCAQEIIPLYLLYRAMIYLFLLAQKDTALWMHI
jgi:hypothetical protein